MRVSGFTFVRNAHRYGYPVVESIRSALPLVDEFVVAVGRCDDGTRESIAAIGDPRIRIIDTEWNEKAPALGFLLAQQKMIAEFNCTGDWAIYIEADEVLHEDDLPALRESMARHLPDPRVEALYVDFLHFYGSAEWLAQGHVWYKQEARVIRNDLRAMTTDSLYFLVFDHKKRGRYPRAASAGARYFHYGHCRASAIHAVRRKELMEIDHNAPAAIDEIRAEAIYCPDIRLLKRFEGTHPAVMKEWIATRSERNFTPVARTPLKGRALRNYLGIQLGRLTGLDLSKRHFTRVD
jgi:glycosyltransferase involved in cell wall biosynthesis